MMTIRTMASVLLMLCLAPSLFAAPSLAPELEIRPTDIEIVQSIEGGYDLYIRERPGIGSVLLTESTTDPGQRLAVYALRNPEYHPANGDEIRLLDGEVLVEEKWGHSLIDSTLEEHAEFGMAFRIFVPYIVVFGYPWSRSGEIQVLDSTFMNIRSFAREHADYDGPYRDNPYMLRVTQKPLPPPDPEEEVVYMAEAVETLTDIAEEGKGKAVLSTGAEDLGRQIGAILDDTHGETLDLVLALDTTRSMRNDMEHLRAEIVPMLREHTSSFRTYRVGLLFYRDYYDTYLVRPLPFVTDLAEVQRHIDTIRVDGGRDIPEAVYEALYHSIHEYLWLAEARLIILVGDAPPHPRPRGKITKEMVHADAEAAGIQINTIILPP